MPAVSSALRKRAGQVARQLTRMDQVWLAGQVAALVGFSEECGRMLVYALSGATFFEPIVTTRLIVPDPGGLCSAPLNMPELVGFARPQLACVRESYPQASGGTLQVAELRPDRMTCWTVPDFDVGDAHTSATCGAGS